MNHPSMIGMNNHQRKRINVGICALEKKTLGTNTQLLLDYLYNESSNDENNIEYKFFCFKDDTIFNTPVTQWPVCHALLCYHSCDFPLDKAINYVNMLSDEKRNGWRIFDFNDVKIQKDLLLNRLQMYKHLESLNIPVPYPYLVIDHIGNGQISDKNAVLEEQDNFIQWNNGDDHKILLKKPFVEKPVDANDHNIYIYYENNGGCRKLFRKEKNKSSCFDRENNRIRRDSTYIYEPYQKLYGGYDIKVYMVGDFNEQTLEIYELYVHAEQRKSPSIDGVVQRTENGLEVRNRVQLSDTELDYCKKVLIGFRQRICGFDILRIRKQGLSAHYDCSNTKEDFISVICDVNGYSNVKSDTEFYRQCAAIMYRAVQRRIKEHNF